jgi:hypothetical protein
MNLEQPFDKDLTRITALHQKHEIYRNVDVWYSSVRVFEVHLYINPLNTKRKRFYLKTQPVPRSKHFSSRL